MGRSSIAAAKSSLTWQRRRWIYRTPSTLDGRTYRPDYRSKKESLPGRGRNVVFASMHDLQTMKTISFAQIRGTVLCLLLLASPAIAQEIKVDFQKLTQETQKVVQNPNKLGIVWWMPE